MRDVRGGRVRAYTMSEPPPTLLLTGATGFVGGELLRALRDQVQMRLLVRDPSGMDLPNVVQADLSDRNSLEAALEGMEEAYYLVHSMEPGATGGFAEADRDAATNFAAVASSCGLRRTIYMGGVVDEEGESEHLDSRREVEQILAEAAPELVVLRASMIVGAASGSFRSLVQLVDRMPVLLLPNWRDRRSQPVAIEDVVSALIAARDVEPGVYNVAGPDEISFERMTEVVAELLGQRHRSIPMPFSNSKLEGAAASVVADADSELLQPLMAGLHSNLIVTDNSLAKVFGVEPTSFEDAARAAIMAMEEVEPAD